MNISIADRPALILMDFQKAFDNIAYWVGQRNNANAEANAGELLKIWQTILAMTPLLSQTQLQHSITKV